MEVDVNEEGAIRLKEVYETIILVAETETLFIAERDGKFEIRISAR